MSDYEAAFRKLLEAKGKAAGDEHVNRKLEDYKRKIADEQPRTVPGEAAG